MIISPNPHNPSDECVTRDPHMADVLAARVDNTEDATDKTKLDQNNSSSEDSQVTTRTSDQDPITKPSKENIVPLLLKSSIDSKRQRNNKHLQHLSLNLPYGTFAKQPVQVNDMLVHYRKEYTFSIHKVIFKKFVNVEGEGIDVVLRPIV